MTKSCFFLLHHARMLALRLYGQLIGPLHYSGHSGLSVLNPSESSSCWPHPPTAESVAPVDTGSLPCLSRSSGNRSSPISSLPTTQSLWGTSSSSIAQTGRPLRRGGAVPYGTPPPKPLLPRPITTENRFLVTWPLADLVSHSYIPESESLVG